MILTAQEDLSVDLTLQKWVKDYGGPVKLALRLDVYAVTVRHWLHRRGYPKVDTMRKLIQISKNALSYESIIESCRPK